MYTTTIKGLKGKLVLSAALLLLAVNGNKALAQDQPRVVHAENFGNTLNIGVGFLYSSNLDASVPIFMINYEFNVARDFTLAPFIGIASYTSGTDYRYGGDYYYYRETIVPIGIKGTYYFDRLLGLNPKWDIYAAASLGYTFDKVTWQDGYAGDEGVAHDVSPLFLDLHIGAEYHINRRTGVFLDLSTGVNTVGLAFHGRR